MHKPTKIFAIALTIAVIFTACGVPSAKDADKGAEQPVASSVVINSNDRVTESKVVYEKTSPIEVNTPYSDDEVTAIATTLAGECYDDKLEDKRSVAEVICNRV